MSGVERLCIHCRRTITRSWNTCPECEGADVTVAGGKVAPAGREETLDIIADTHLSAEEKYQAIFPPAGEVVPDEAFWRKAWIVERARHYRRDGLKIEQAEIHAEADAAMAPPHAYAKPQPAPDAKHAEAVAFMESEGWRWTDNGTGHVWFREAAAPAGEVVGYVKRDVSEARMVANLPEGSPLYAAPPAQDFDAEVVALADKWAATVPHPKANARGTLVACAMELRALAAAAKGVG